MKPNRYKVITPDVADIYEELQQSREQVEAAAPPEPEKIDEEPEDGDPMWATTAVANGWIVGSSSSIFTNGSSVVFHSAGSINPSPTMGIGIGGIQWIDEPQYYHAGAVPDHVFGGVTISANGANIIQLGESNKCDTFSAETVTGQTSNLLLGSYNTLSNGTPLPSSLTVEHPEPTPSQSVSEKPSSVWRTLKRTLQTGLDSIKQRVLYETLK
jgi:hypothetical protein